MGRRRSTVTGGVQGCYQSLLGSDCQEFIAEEAVLESLYEQGRWLLTLNLTRRYTSTGYRPSMQHVQVWIYDRAEKSDYAYLKCTQRLAP